MICLYLLNHYINKSAIVVWKNVLEVVETVERQTDLWKILIDGLLLHVFGL